MKRRWIEFLLLLTGIACGVALFLAPPSEPPPLSVNGLTLRMSLVQAKKELGPQFRMIPSNEHEFEFRGPGEFPTSVFVQCWLERDEAGRPMASSPENLSIISITGTEVVFPDGVRWKPGVEGPHYEDDRHEDLIVRHTTEDTGWARMDDSGNRPIAVGITWGHLSAHREEHSSSFAEVPPFIHLPVRSPGLISAKAVTVDGVRVGMSGAEVRKLLGPPKESTQRDQFTHLNYPVETEVTLKDDRVIFIDGETLYLNGEAVGKTGVELSQFLDRLGRVDDTHARGFAGGTTIYCWSEPDLVIEIAELEEGKVGEISIIDPRSGSEPHYWWKGMCGGR